MSSATPTTPTPTAQATRPAVSVTVPTRPIDPAKAAAMTRRWFTAWALVLAGLAVGGKGFAYIGLPPLFISEVIVALGVGVLLLQPRWRELAASPTTMLIGLLLAWTAWRTVPYLGRYGMDAPRDAVIVGYALAGLAVAAGVMSQPKVLPWLLRRYQTFAKVFLVVMPGLWLANQFVGESIPGWPWAGGVGVFELKPGDISVHLGAIAALATLGLFRGRSLLWIMALVALLGVSGAISRGGLLSFGAAFAVAFCLHPTSRWAWRFLVTGLLIAGALTAADVSVEVPGRGRELSARQLVTNVASVFHEAETGDLDGTKAWRLEWWDAIVGYTVFGEYRWSGKGFGVNLATADGFQVNEQETLRSPHNGHLTLLARGGVPALGLWVAVQAAWLIAMANAYLRARQRREANWAAWLGFLTAYWLAMMLNASADVYFEGPMGGLWYWSVIGLGIASVWVFRHRPEVMRVDHATPREA
ncbi:MAG: O-antigen ligase family protein [Planctomycetota bacterium]